MIADIFGSHKSKSVKLRILSHIAKLNLVNIFIQ